MNLLVIDVGTSSMRGVLMDGLGKTLHIHQVEYEATYASGTIVEQAPEHVVFAGTIGPFSLAGRLMDVTEAMIYCYDDPDMVHTLLQKCTDFLIDYMRAYNAHVR